MNKTKDLNGFIDYVSKHKMGTKIRRLYDAYMNDEFTSELNDLDRLEENILIIIENYGKEGFTQFRMNLLLRSYDKSDRKKIIDAILSTGKVHTRSIIEKGSSKETLVYFYKE